MVQFYITTLDREEKRPHKRKRFGDSSSNPGTEGEERRLSLSARILIHSDEHLLVLYLLAKPKVPGCSCPTSTFEGTVDFGAFCAHRSLIDQPEIQGKQKNALPISIVTFPPQHSRLNLLGCFPDLTRDLLRQEAKCLLVTFDLDLIQQRWLSKACHDSIA